MSRPPPGYEPDDNIAFTKEPRKAVSFGIKSKKKVKERPVKKSKEKKLPNLAPISSEGSPILSALKKKKGVSMTEQMELEDADLRKKIKNQPWPELDGAVKPTQAQIKSKWDSM